MGDLFLGEYLNEYMKVNNIDKKDIADLFGVGENAIVSWIKYGKQPKLEKMCQLSIFLGVSLESFLNRKEKIIRFNELNYLDYKNGRKKQMICKLDKLSSECIIRIIRDYLSMVEQFYKDIIDHYSNKKDMFDFYENNKKRWNELSLYLYDNSSNIKFFIFPEKKIDISCINDTYLDWKMKWIPITYDENINIFLKQNGIKYEEIIDKVNNKVFVGEILKEDDDFLYLCTVLDKIMKIKNNINIGFVIELIKYSIRVDIEIVNFLMKQDSYVDLIVRYINMIGKREVPAFIFNSIYLSLNKEKIFKFDNSFNFQPLDNNEYSRLETGLAIMNQRMNSNIKTEILYAAYLRDMDITQYVSMKDFCIALFNKSEYIKIDFEKTIKKLLDNPQIVEEFKKSLIKNEKGEKDEKTTNII